MSAFLFAGGGATLLKQEIVNESFNALTHTVSLANTYDLDKTIVIPNNHIHYSLSDSGINLVSAELTDVDEITLTRNNTHPSYKSSCQCIVAELAGIKQIIDIDVSGTHTDASYSSGSISTPIAADILSSTFTIYQMNIALPAGTDTDKCIVLFRGIDTTATDLRAEDAISTLALYDGAAYHYVAGANEYYNITKKYTVVEFV